MYSISSLATGPEIGVHFSLAFHARDSTKDIDAYFVPTQVVRKAAGRVAQKEGIAADWINDAVKGYLSPKGKYEPFLELSHLKVYCARADYLLAMKCLAFRIGAEFHDEVDVRYLLRFLNIESYEQARQTIERFYPIDRFPQKTFYALEEILGPHSV